MEDVNSLSRKIEPNIPKNISSDAMFVIVNVRSRKKFIGSIGVSVRSSQSTNATTRAAPAVSETTISGLVQP
jgi:hypothetical protein